MPCEMPKYPMNFKLIPVPKNRLKPEFKQGIFCVYQ